MPNPTSADSLRLCWLHLSDLHFEATLRWERRTVLTSLLEHLEKHELRPDLVFVTGDIAHSGKEDEYAQAEAFLGSLMERLKLDPHRHLFVVPGNHDADRTRIGKMDGRTVRSLVDDAQEDDFNVQEIEDLLGDVDAISSLSRRLDAFYAFTRRLLGEGHGWDPRRPWRTDTVEVGATSVGIVGLNSAWASGPDDAKGRLLIGASQAHEALHELPDVTLKVGLVHHPLSWLAGPDERSVGGLLRAPGGVDFLLTGHLHDAEAVGRLRPDGTTMELAAGATYVGGRWPKSAILVSLEGEKQQGTVHFLGFTDRGRGFWHPDNSLYERAKDGRWSFPLPAALSSARPSEGATLDPSARIEAQVARYRSASATYHASVSVLGLSFRGHSVQKNDVGDLFVPLVAGSRGQSEGGLAPEDIVKSLLSRDERGRAGRVVLLGDPGSGKTTLTRAMAVWAAGRMTLGALEPSGDLVPLRIPFREYVADLDRYGEQGLVDFLVRQSASTLDLPRTRDFFEGVLASGRTLVLLDGLDEVSRPDQRDETVRRVRVFAERWEKTPILVTSRVVGYADAPLPDASGGASMGDEETLEPTKTRRRAPSAREMASPAESTPIPFTHLVLRPLSDEAVDQLVERWYQAREPVDRRLREQLVADLRGALAASPTIRELARNPLLATLICVVHGHRAKLPGERVKLYEEVVDTLLDTWNAVKKGTEAFTDLDPGRQRRYLERLALGMMADRAETGVNEWIARPRTEEQSAEAARAGIVLSRDDLLKRLVTVAREDAPGEDDLTCRRRMDRWVGYLAARTGLLVEQRPGWFGFLHLTLQEFLAACALKSSYGDCLVTEIEARAATPAWRETVRLVLGLKADEPAFVKALLVGFEGRPAQRDRVLCDGLREEMDLPADERRKLVGRVLPAANSADARQEREATLGALTFAARLSPRHREGLRDDAAEVLLSGADGSNLDLILLRRLPDLLAPERLLAVTEHLRRLTRDGDYLHLLWRALDASADRKGARDAQDRFFDHIPASDRERALKLMAPWWREIPAGRFLMGSPEDEAGRLPSEGPQHVVQITSPYLMLAVPVTNQMFRCFNPSHQGPDLQPVTGVSWYASTFFASWLGFRLPREAEWEYACRAGTTFRFWSGDSEKDLARVCWYEKNSNGETHSVGVKPANPWGLHDMHGNVWEWTSDVWATYDSASASIDPNRPAPDLFGASRVFRGGACRVAPSRCRSAFRSGIGPGDKYHVLGFRLVAASPNHP